MWLKGVVQRSFERVKMSYEESNPAWCAWASSSLAAPVSQILSELEESIDPIRGMVFECHGDADEDGGAWVWKCPIEEAAFRVGMSILFLKDFYNLRSDALNDIVRRISAFQVVSPFDTNSVHSLALSFSGLTHEEAMDLGFEFVIQGGREFPILLSERAFRILGNSEEVYALLGGVPCGVPEHEQQYQDLLNLIKEMKDENN
jgi:hypothetical protein